MFCKNCGKELPESAKFCSACGVRVDADPQESASVQAPPVSTPAQAAAPAEVPVSPESAAPAQPILGQKKHGKGLLLLAVALVVVLLLVVGAVKLLPGLLGGGSASETVIYASDDETFLLEALSGEAEPQFISDEALSDLQMTEDGRYLAYTEEDTLYFARVADLEKKEAVKVSKDVLSFVLSDPKTLVYLTEDGEIELFNGKDSVQILEEEGIHNYSLSVRDGSVYFTKDNHDLQDLCRAPLEADAKTETLIKKFSHCYTSYSDDLLVFSRLGNDSTWDLFSAQPGEKPQPLLEDVSQLLEVSVDDGKVRASYLTQAEESRKLSDFVSDDLKEQDAAASVEPSYEDYRVVDADGWTSIDYDAYYEARDAWSDAANRNELREQLAQEDFTLTTYTLFLYENGASTELASNLSSGPQLDADSQVFLYQKVQADPQPVIDLSQLSSFSYEYEITSALAENGSGTWYQNIGGQESPLELDPDTLPAGFFILEDSTVVMKLLKGETSLVNAYGIEQNQLVQKETLCKALSGEIYQDRWQGKDAVFYFDGVKDGEGELMCYCGGKTLSLVDDIYGVFLLNDGQDCFVVTDQDDDGITLAALQDGETLEIAEEIDPYSMSFRPDGKLFYTSDEDLFFWNGKESLPLADDVQFFVNFYESYPAVYAPAPFGYSGGSYSEEGMYDADFEQPVDYE